MPGQSAAFTSAPLAAPRCRSPGSPTVRIRVRQKLPGAEVTLFAKVYDVDQGGDAILPYDLAAPLRVGGAQGGRTVTVTLPPVDYSFSAGHRLRLVLTTTDFSYATQAAPAVYRVALASRLTVPTDPALTVTGSGAPWWVWAAPAAALAAAALILLLRRRRGRDELIGELAGVPLEISGLAKRYADGQLAVDGLSLRVEHGQILGLLGPNGAGKTTTLRALMGLVHPDAGTITIFGRRVHPGSPALSRLGSFVEGPGFLPHLSGLANLELYWQGDGPARRRVRPGRGTGHRGPRAGHRPPGPALLPQDVPAPGHRPGHAGAAGPAGARRADERPRPTADQGDARRAAALRGRRADRHPVQPPARRGRADLQSRGRDEPGQAHRWRPGGRHHRRGSGLGGGYHGGRPRRRGAARPDRDRLGGGAPRRRPGTPQRRACLRRGRRAGRGFCDPGGPGRAQAGVSKTPSWP